MGKVSKEVCSIDSTPVIFKLWMPLFNARKVRMDEIPMWVCFLGLPSIMWNSHSFTKLGNSLGHFLGANYFFMMTRDTFVAQVLVFLDLHKRLHATMDIGKGVPRL